MTLGEPIDVGANPTFLARARAGADTGDAVIAVVHELPEGLVSTWAGVEDLQARSEPISTGAAAPCHLAYSEEAGALYVANYHGGTVAAFRAASALQGSTVLTLTGGSVHPLRQVQPHPHQVVHDDARRRLLVPDLGADRIRSVSFDPERPWDLEHDRRSDIALHAGAGPRHLVVAGRLAIVANELDRSLSIVDLHEGMEMAWTHVGSDAPPRFGLSAVRVTRAGMVLVADRDVDGVHALHLDATAARLEPVASLKTGGRHPRDMELTGDERTLLVADQASDSIAAIALGRDGIPQSVVDVISTPAPTCLLHTA